MSSGPRVVVVGTGTSIGKTHVTGALLLAWLRQGRQVTALKPVESGVGAEGEGDQAALARVVSFHVKHSIAEEQAPCGEGRRPPQPDAGALFHVKHSPAIPGTGLYSFADPISPHLAARKTSSTIDLAAVREWIQRYSADVTLVESAGGLFSPLSRTTDNLDLAAALMPAFVLLVASDRLGALHDTRGALQLAEHRGLPIHAVVLSAPEHPDSSTGTNADELRWLGVTPPVFTFLRAAVEADATATCAAEVTSRIEQSWPHLWPGR